MGSITIYVPQTNIQIEYTLNHESITQRVLEMLNTLLLRNTPKSGNDKDELLGLFSDESELIDQIVDQAMQDRQTDVLQAVS